MILDSISEISRYQHIHPGFSDTFRYILQNDMKSFSPGKSEIIDRKLFAITSLTAGKGQSNAQLEVHREFIDIQCTIEGSDKIGWKALSDCKCPQGGFDQMSDIQFFLDISETWFDLSPGKFAIFFPTDAHAPLATDGTLKKIVFKVAVNWYQK
jgi:biofilm protein TabA